MLGCLVEKAATTPDVYPLTLNALQLACNQKSSREPVMNVELGDIGHALSQLEERQLARVQRGARAVRYEHRIESALGLAPRARAVIALLLLRGPQTMPELHARSDRLADFPDLASVGDTLERLIAREPPLVVRIPRRSGQREDRYMHLLCGPVPIDDEPAARTESRAESGEAASSVAHLEARIETLEQIVADLQRRLGS